MNPDAPFIDPRSDPSPTATRSPPRTTAHSDDVAELHHLCRAGRLYDVERWIQEGRPLQAGGETVPGRHATTAMEIALDRGNRALVFLLLCNGYDANLDDPFPLNLVLRNRQWDLVDLFLEWGADPFRVDLSDLFGTYRSELWERFLAFAGIRIGVPTLSNVPKQDLGPRLTVREIRGIGRDLQLQ